MTDVFVTKLRKEVQKETEHMWAKRINTAIRSGMDHKGDMMSKYSTILANIRAVTDEMEKS